MENKKRNKKSGFTLIELVVVIAIIGVLAAVITPRVRLALYKAKDAKAIATLEALRTAVNVYHAETGSKFTAGALKKADIGTLETKGYLDAKAAKILGNTGDDAIAIETGVAVEPGGCSVGSTPASPASASLGVTVGSDGVDLAFDGGTKVDTSCNVWADK